MAGALYRRSVLIYDENDDSAKMLIETLKGQAIGRVRRAGSFPQASKMLDDGDIDLVLVDWSGSSTAALDFVKSVRRRNNDQIRRVPIVMLTTAPDRDKIMAILAAGAHEIVVKPLKAAEVVAKAQAALSDTRKFVISDDYTGPERRVVVKSHGGPERRQ